MTANEPPNPYAAPSASLAHDPASPGARRAARALALAAAFLAYPVAGMGFCVLGHQRRFVVLTAAGLMTWVLLIVSVWVPVPKMCVFAFAAFVALWLPALIATGLAKPAGAVKHAWLIAVLAIVGVRGAGVAVKQWLVEAFKIPSGAMVPTLLVGDHIMVKKGRHVERGDIVVFEFPQDRSTDYIKRVVAVGGDTIHVRDGVPAVNGIPLDHEKIAEPCTHEVEPVGVEPCTLVRETNGGRSYTIMFSPGADAADFRSMVVPDGELFVMGDNRDNSYDSRKWGTVPIDHVKGKATLTWWSRDATTGVRWSRVGRGVE
jgi:signal peptidase I